jgi:hypothetical protein
MMASGRRRARDSASRLAWALAAEEMELEAVWLALAPWLRLQPALFRSEGI